MSDYRLPELPSDEELGITDLGDAAAAPTEEPRTAAGAPAGPSQGDGSPGTERAEPQRRWRGPLTLALLALMAWLSSTARAVPDPVPAAAPDTVFSSARAMVELVELARRPHPTGSPEHARVRQMIVDRLEALGLEPEVQTATASVRRGSTLTSATVRNVVARLPGTDPTGAILVTAHYDGRTLSPAAADDGSGVATILETLRAVRAGPPLRNDLIVLITDGEELGLLGARAFVAEHPWMADVSIVLSVEMRGAGGPSIMFETGEDNGWIVDALAAGDPVPFANSLSYEVYRRLPNDTDFTPFREAGKQGLNFAAIGRAHVYHQTFDTPQNLQEATVQHHGLQLLGMVRELGGRDLTNVDGPDEVFFRLPWVGLVKYGAGWVPAVGLGIAALAVLVLLLGKVRDGSLGSAVAGFLLGLFASAGAGAAGWGLFRWVRGFHPEYGSLAGSAFHSEGWYVLALVGAAFTLVTGLLGLVRRKGGSLLMLTAGAALLPLLAALYLTFAAPMAAMNLQWPVLAGIGGAIVAGGVGRRRPGLLRWLLLLVLAAPAVAMLVPLIELLWVAMSFSLAPVLGVLAAWTLVLLLPLLDVLSQPNRWWAPVTGLVLAAGFTGVGLLHARPSPERPTPTTLFYALDHQTDRAEWVTAADTARGLAWVRTRVGELSAPSELEAFLAPRPGATDRQGPPDSSSSMEDRDLRRPPRFLTGSAPVVTVPPPEARLAGPPVNGPVGNPPPSGGSVRVALRSASGAEAMAVWADDGTEARWVSINGRPVGPRSSAGSEGQVRAIMHWGVPEDALVLELEPAPGIDTLRLVVVEHHLRPSELVGPDYFTRPPDRVADVGGLSDRALIRSVVTVPLQSDPDATEAEAATDAGALSEAAAAGDTLRSGGTYPGGS